MTTTPTATSVNASEFVDARERLELTPEVLAYDLGLTPHIIEGFEDGSVTIPKDTAAEMRWRIAALERQQALAASGLPVCPWVTHWEDLELPSASRDKLKHLQALADHTATCPTCTAREEFVAQHFGPMPERPLPGWLGIVAAIVKRVERLPGWLRPAAYGAVLFVAMSAVRVVLAIPLLRNTPGGWLIALEGLAASAALGAVVGSAYAVVRRTWRTIRGKQPTGGVLK